MTGCWHYDHNLCKYQDPKHCDHRSIFRNRNIITCPRLTYKNIEWLSQEGKTWNPITGCNGPGGIRCGFCYAQRIAERFKGRNGFPSDDPFKPTWHGDRLKIVYSRRKPTLWFAGSMCDWLDDGVLPNWRGDCMTAMRQNPRHAFITLTKQTWNLSKLLDDAPDGPQGKAIPPNMFVGISVTNAQQVDGLKTLRDLRGVKKVVSFEPLMEDVAAAMGFGNDDALRFDQAGRFIPSSLHLHGIDWVFIGGCSKQSAIGDLPKVPAFIPPHQWVMRLWMLAKASGCKVFVKPNAHFELLQGWSSFLPCKIDPRLATLMEAANPLINTQEYPSMVERVLLGLPALDKCPECGQEEPYVPDKTGLPSISCYKCGWPPRED